MSPTTGASGCIAWPDPVLTGFPCGGSITDAALERWEPVATQMMFAESGFRFPGTVCDVLLRVHGIVGCGGGSSEADLTVAIPYPILEVLEVNVDGVADPAALDRYWLRGQRWLTVDEGTAWHPDNSRKRPGAAGTTTFRVRYGREPDPVLVTSRDELLWNLVMANDPPTQDAAVHVVEGVTQLSENGRTIVIEPGQVGSNLLEWARKQYPRRAQQKSRLYDLAEHHYAPTVELIPEED